jgi:hypothetical protein
MRSDLNGQYFNLKELKKRDRFLPGPIFGPALTVQVYPDQLMVDQLGPVPETREAKSTNRMTANRNTNIFPKEQRN